MRYWFKEYQVKCVYLLNSSRHQDSNPFTPRIHESFLQDSLLFWFWQLYSHLENNTSSCFAFCAKLCSVICPPAAMTQLHFLVLFFPLWELVSSHQYRLPSALTASCTLGPAFSNLCFYLSTLWVLEQNYVSLRLHLPRPKDYSPSQALVSFPTFILEFILSKKAEPTEFPKFFI